MKVKLLHNWANFGKGQVVSVSLARANRLIELNLAESADSSEQLAQNPVETIDESLLDPNFKEKIVIKPKTASRRKK